MHNTPPLETPRLILRRFTEDDIPAILAIHSDAEVNTFLPWFPLTSLEDAAGFYRSRYAACYRQAQGYRYAVCLKSGNVPIGYVHVSMDDSHDFGYGLARRFWGQGIITEASRAVVSQVEKDGLRYITATHDVNNPRSGAVMRRLGMVYRYSYVEQWQPKDFPVTFRLYQRNFDGSDFVYEKYRQMYPNHFVEPGL